MLCGVALLEKGEELENIFTVESVITYVCSELWYFAQPSY
jgi:hypothetical protein